MDTTDDMDTTGYARSLLMAVTVHRTAGLEVLRSADGRGEVAVPGPGPLANVIDSMHSSGLITLIDAAGLAAILSVARTPAETEGVLALGRSASLEFLAPARGRLTAVTELGPVERAAVRSVLSGTGPRTRLTTSADITDAEGKVVCRGSFTWSLRRS
ncbi:PaaI family thioesterase [Actinocorallia herbida]|nr:DUF4442 domain-containing protein [Actinocorallia herbida]